MQPLDLTNKKLSISACLIVKNEEKVLATCLQSIKDYVDEIIVVDTGSTDRTVAIAESFGARVYHHPWENHFSKHRNQSFGYARGDWILYIDADEELLPGSGQVLLEAVKINDNFDAITVILECVFGQNGAKATNNSIRIFRNHRGLHYEGRVHNYIVGVKKVLCAPIHIFHHGYILDRETQLRRFKRTTDLLNLDIAEDPENPRPHHFLAASYLSENRFKEAIREAEQALRLYEIRRSYGHNYLWTLYILASSYLELGELEMAEQAALKGIGVNPDHLDSHYCLSLIAYRQKKLSYFKNHFERYREIKTLIEKDPGRFGEMVHNTFASEWRLHLFDAFLILNEPEAHRFRNAWELSRLLCPDLFLFYQQSASCYWQHQDFEQAKGQYLRALELRPDHAGTLWVLSHVYEKLKDFPNQILLLEKLLKIDPQFPHARFQLALTYMRVGDFKKSFDLFAKTGQSEPSNRLIQINKALCLRGMGQYAESIEASAPIETDGPLEQAALTGNLAYCHYALGQLELASAHFQKWSELQPHSPEPPVYLARIFLERNEFEACVTQCNQLLTILGLNKNQVLDSLAELGALFFTISRHSSLVQRPDLSQVCEEISRLLGYQKRP
jgi:tetratricopeptide (TPR) repeat protein